MATNAYAEVSNSSSQVRHPKIALWEALEERWHAFADMRTRLVNLWPAARIDDLMLWSWMGSASP